MKHLLNFLCALTLTSTFVACGDKEDDPEPAAADPRTTLLINKDWRMTADVTETTVSNGTKTTTDNKTITDNYALLTACGKDDFIRFNDDNSLRVDEGPSKCGANDPQTQNGKWSWNADKTIITFSEPSFREELPDELSGPADLTSSTLVVKQTYTENGSTKVRTVTYGSF